MDFWHFMFSSFWVYAGITFDAMLFVAVVGALANAMGGNK